MENLMDFLTVYYHCSTLAETYELSQPERFACNDTYQHIKRLFVGAEPNQSLTFEENTRGYRLFKTWEAENQVIVHFLKAR